MADMVPLYRSVAPQVLCSLAMSSFLPQLRLATCASDTQNIYPLAGHKHLLVGTVAAVLLLDHEDIQGAPGKSE